MDCQIMLLNYNCLHKKLLTTLSEEKSGAQEV